MRGPAHHAHPSATIEFERGASDAGTEVLSALDGIVGRGSTDLSIRVLVVGFANECDLLTENLDLAERRGRFIANHLIVRGVAQGQIVVVGREAAPDDRAGARTDVQILEASSGLNMLSGPRIALL